jgi:hypothetical protein
MLNIGEYEQKKEESLKLKLADSKLTAEERKLIVLEDIAESLRVIAGKIGRKLL